MKNKRLNSSKGENMNYENIRGQFGFDKGIKLFIHKKTSEKDVYALCQGMNCAQTPREHDDNALILAYTTTAVAYRLHNCVYLIPAIKRELPVAVTKNVGEKPCVHIAFDYPCEMREEDLIEL